MDQLTEFDVVTSAGQLGRTHGCLLIRPPCVQEELWGCKRGKIGPREPKLGPKTVRREDDQEEVDEEEEEEEA